MGLVSLKHKTPNFQEEEISTVHWKGDSEKKLSLFSIGLSNHMKPFPDFRPSELFSFIGLVKLHLLILSFVLLGER